MNLMAGSQMLLHVDGPAPIPVEVGMVPDLKPDPPLDPGQFQSIMKINDVTFDAEHQRHFFKTILPHNIVRVPRVTFTPDDPGGSLQAVVRVFDQDGLATLQPIEQVTNSPPGSSATFRVDGTCANAFCREILVGIYAGRELVRGRAGGWATGRWRLFAGNDGSNRRTVPL